MTASATTSTSRTVDLADGLSVTIAESGTNTAGSGANTAESGTNTENPGGPAVLLLHGGAGPGSVAGLAAALSRRAYVVAPVHPGFDGTPRPEWTDSFADLALAYLDLLDALDLNQVMVIGNSLGGQIAAEMALRDTRGRLGCLVLLNAAGIEPDNDGDLTDVRTVPPAELGALSFADPAFRPDPAKLTDGQRAVMAANRQTQAVYSGANFTYDPKLRRRLRRVTMPVLVAWGEQDGVFSTAYGRTYAAAFPDARFVPIPGAGHFPQIEQLDATVGAIDAFAGTVVKPGANA